MNPDEAKDALARTLNVALQIKPEAVRKDAQSLMLRHSKKTRCQVAEYVVSKMSHYVASVGFVSGFPSNLACAAPAALIDMGISLRQYAYVCALVGYLADEYYFSDPTWKNDVVILLAPQKVLSEGLGEVGVQAAKVGTKRAIKSVLQKEALAAVKRFFLKHLGRKVTQKGIIAKTVPVIGGIVGGAWNGLEARFFGRKIIQYHFKGEMS